MFYKQVTKGATDVEVPLKIVDSTDGTPETGVAFDTSGIDLWYRRDGAAKVSITEATQTVGAAHTDGGFVHISDGEYRLDVPDAAFATGVNSVRIGGTVTGMVVIGCYIDLMDPVNVSGGIIEANAKQCNGTNLTARDIGASVLVGDKTGFSLSSSQTFNMTGNITGSVSGSVGSVTGAVGSVTGNVGGNVTGSVGSVTAQVSANLKKINDVAITGDGSGTPFGV